MSAEKEFMEAVGAAPEKTTEKEPKAENSDIEFLKSQVSTLSTQLETLQHTNKILLEKLPTPNSDKSKSEDDDDDVFEDVEPVTYKKFEETLEKKLDAKLQKRDQQATWNVMADKHFEAYGFNDVNSRFHKEVKSEVLKDPNTNNPKFIYDAAARVLARGMQEGWVKRKEPEAMRDYSVSHSQGAYPTPRGRGASEQIEISPMARTLMGAWGISETKYKEVMADGGSTGARIARRDLLSRGGA